MIDALALERSREQRFSQLKELLAISEQDQDKAHQRSLEWLDKFHAMTTPRNGSPNVAPQDDLDGIEFV